MNNRQTSTTTLFAIAVLMASFGLAPYAPLANAQPEAKKSLSREAFSQLMTQFEKKYLPFVNDHYRGRAIVFDHNYDSTAVTAGQPHAVHINARTLTYPHIDEAGFTLFGCGEFQKFLSFRGADRGYVHAAHYLSVPNCLKRLWQDDHLTNSAYRHVIPPYLKMLCDQTYPEWNKRMLCYRTVWSAYSLARSGRQPITIDKPSPKRASGIARRHQGMQCLFDVQLAAALCDKGDLDPKVSSLDEFLAYACSARDGLPPQATLPKCFYNPN